MDTDALALRPGFFQREPREHLREKRKKKEYFDDLARPFAPAARKTIILATIIAPVALRPDNTDAYAGSQEIFHRFTQMDTDASAALPPGHAALLPGHAALLPGQILLLASLAVLLASPAVRPNNAASCPALLRRWHGADMHWPFRPKIPPQAV